MSSTQTSIDLYNHDHDEDCYFSDFFDNSYDNGYGLSSKQLNNCQITDPDRKVFIPKPVATTPTQTEDTQLRQQVLKMMENIQYEEPRFVPFKFKGTENQKHEEIEKRKETTKGDIEYITNTPSQPLFLLDLANREIVSPLDKTRYQTIYYIMQNQHVSNQREFYDKYKDRLQDFFKWRETDISYLEQLYLLVLTKRFNEEELTDWRATWYNGFKEYMDSNFPVCAICGVPNIGKMCNDKEWNHPLYVRFHN